MDGEASNPAPIFTYWQKLRIMVGVMSGAFLGAMDHSVVAPALPVIGRDTGAGSGISWVVTAYLLAGTVGIPLFGKLCDTLGRRPTLLIAVCGFMLGSVVCALSVNLPMLIAARSFQGIFGGAMQAVAHIIIADVIAPRERGRFQGYVLGMFAVSGMIGPILGGVIADHIGWRFIFWINLPLGLAAIVISSKVLRRVPGTPRGQRLDVLGIFFVTGGAIPLLLALSFGGHAFAWFSPAIVGLVAAWGLMWTLFFWHIRRAPEPFMPPSLLSNPVIATCFIGSILAVGSIAAVSLYIPLYFQRYLGFSAGQSALALITTSMSTLLGSFTAGYLTSKLAHYKVPTLIGVTCAALSAFVLSATLDDLPTPALFPLLSIIGFGAGSFFPLSAVSAQNAAPPKLLGVTVSGLNFVRALGQSTMIALIGTIVLPSGQTACDARIAACAASGSGGFSLAFAVIGLAFATTAVLIALMRAAPLRGST